MIVHPQSNKRNTKAIVLAAGKNSRFWPLGQDKHKCMYKIGTGKPVLFYVLSELVKAGIKDIIVVARKTDDTIKKYIKNLSLPGTTITLVEQPRSLGMGNAILQSRSLIGNAKKIFVLNPNHVNCREIIDSFTKRPEFFSTNPQIACQVTSNPYDFGIVEIKRNIITSIQEKPRNPRGNMRVVGIYCLSPEFIDNWLTKFKGEYGLEQAIDSFLKIGGICNAVKIKKSFLLYSLKYPWDLINLNRFILDDEITAATSSAMAIGGKVSVEGPVLLGKNIKFLGRAVIKGPCYIGSNVVIGDYAVIRDHSFIGNNCVIGCNSEIKNSILGENLHTHNNFIGDSILGDGSTLGAGCITANRRIDRGIIKSVIKGKTIPTGRNSLGIICGANVKAGINCSFMPGIKIGNNSMVGPHTLVNRDVPDNNLVFSEFKQNKKKIIHHGE